MSTWKPGAAGAARLPVTLGTGLLVLALSACAAPIPVPAGAASGPPSQSATTPASQAPAPGAVRTLAKVDNWRDGLDTPPQVFSALEVAYDAETAQRLWVENVPDGLLGRTGEPAQPGRYDALSSVDFTDQVVALWSGGESGSCPGWVDGVHRDDEGAVVVSETLTSRWPVASDGSFYCTSDRQTYRTVIVVDRANLPGEAEITTARATSGDPAFPSTVYLAAYPSV